MNQREQIIAELLENESFLKWLSGKGDATDNQFWQNWISENTLHEEAFREISETWSVLTFKPIFSGETDAEWQKLNNRLNLGDSASTAPQHPETYLQRRMNREIHSTRWWLGAGSAVAAAFCLVALVWVGFFSGNVSNPMNREVRTGNGEQVRIQLPDQSTVLLNANSALHFSDEWTSGSAVNVVLTGEAFFDISKNPAGTARRFTVQTADGQVRVLGTRFVVYERGDGTTVSLENGRVEVAAQNDHNNPAATAELIPGQSTFFHRNDRQLHANATDSKTRIVWWSDEPAFALDQTPLSVVIRRIEETYGVSVVVKDVALLDRELSGAIENTNIDAVMDALGKVLQIPVKRQGNRVFFN